MSENMKMILIIVMEWSFKHQHVHSSAGCKDESCRDRAPRRISTWGAENTTSSTAGETSKTIWPNISETILRDSNRSVLSMFGSKMECCSTLETHGKPIKDDILGPKNRQRVDVSQLVRCFSTRVSQPCWSGESMAKCLRKISESEKKNSHTCKSC